MTRTVKILGLRTPLWALAIVYVGLTAASWVFEHGAEAAPRDGELALPPLQLDTTGLPVRQNPLPYSGDFYQGKEFEDSEKLPVLLLHGTPGSRSNFRSLGPEIASNGRDVIAVDLPGFGSQREPLRLFGGRGRVFDDYSERFYADLMIRLLDEMEYERVHVVGWSNGGAAAIWMAHLTQDADPELIASVTLLASVGSQDTEGSGDYWFEHAKYAFGYATLVWGAELVPTFGVLGPPSERRAFLRNFWDTDQRKLAEIMPAVETPTLILHGRHDFLTPDWGAERHHELLPASQLAMTPFDHFMPFTKPRVITSRFLEPHFARHDEPGVPIYGFDRYYGEPRPGGLFADVRTWLIEQPYWVGLFLIAALALVARAPAVAVAALLVGVQAVDLGVAVAGMSLGLFVRTPPRRWPGAFVRSLVTIGLLWIPVEIIEVAANGFTTPEALGVLLALGVFYAIGWPVLTHVWTWRGRRRLHAMRRSVAHHEFWPCRFFYGPLAFYLAWLVVRYRGPMTFACVNPGIARGGGLVGERKDEILRAMGPGTERAQVLDHALIEPGPLDERVRTFEQHLDRLGGYPVVIKPNEGQRAYDVRIVRDAAAARRALGANPTRLLAQRYHPGPGEVGVFWMRTPGTDTGRVFAVTIKVFPEITGDGVRTLEQLILGHDRFCIQEGVYRRRFADRWRNVPAEGERIRLASAGNHVQGVEFRDGGRLITEEFERAVSEIALGFEGPNGGAFDFGRFDIRYESEQELMAGKFAVIELNGTTSESTNVYDPDRSVWWAWGVQFGQWKRAFQIGRWRRDRGASPPSVAVLIAWILQQRRTRGGSAVSD